MKSSDQHNKMILSAGCVQSNKKNVFCSQSKNKIGSIYKITNWSCPGGQGTSISVQGPWWNILHRYKNLSNFPEKKYILFSFGVCFPKTVSYRPKHARKCLISNVILNNFSWLSNCYRIFNEIINICTQK